MASNREEVVCIIASSSDVNAKIFKGLFKHLGYHVETLEPPQEPSGLEEQLNDKIKLAVVIVIDKCQGDCKTRDRKELKQKCVTRKYDKIISDASNPDQIRILITHTICNKKAERTKLPRKNTLRIWSQIEDGDKDRSRFSRSMDKIFRKYYNQCDIYELLSKVLLDNEVPHDDAEREVPYNRVIFETSLESPFRFKGTEIQEADFEVKPLKMENVINRKDDGPILKVEHGDTFKFERQHSKVKFEIVSVVLRLKDSIGVTIESKGKDRFVPVLSGLAVFKSTPGMTDLKIKIQGSGFVQSIALRDKENLNNHNWIITQNNKRVPSQVETSIQEHLYSVSEKTLSVKPKSGKKFKLQSVMLEARDAACVTFQWDNGGSSSSQILSLSREWKEVFIPSGKIPQREISELTIKVKPNNNMKYADLKGLEIIDQDPDQKWDSTSVDVAIEPEKLNSNMKSRLFCEPGSFVEVRHKIVLKQKGDAAKTFRLTFLSVQIRHCSKLKFTRTPNNSIFHEYEPPETECWTNVTIPITKIPMELTAELTIIPTVAGIKPYCQLKDFKMKAVEGEGTTGTDDKFPCSNGSFCFSSGQYSDYPKVSKHELKKKFSLDVEIQQMENSKYVKIFKMDRKPRGLAIIINMTSNRPGSSKDEIEMKTLMEELFFITRIITNRTHKEIKEAVTQLLSEIEKAHQCLVVILMAHGIVRVQSADSNKLHEFFDVTGTARPSGYIFDLFDGHHCAQLIGKPKAFIISTCYGVQNRTKVQGEADCLQTHYVTHSSQASTDVTEDLDTDGGQFAQSEAIDITQDATDEDVTDDLDTDGDGDGIIAQSEASDIFKLHATVEGYKSGRDRKGAFLVQGIDEIFREKAAVYEYSHLTKMITTWLIDHEKVQQPVIEMNSAKGFLYLNPGYYANELPKLPNNPDNEVQNREGSVIWQDTENSAYVVRNNNSVVTLDNKTVLQCSKRDVILSGVSMGKGHDRYPDEYFIVVRNDQYKQHKGQRIKGNNRHTLHLKDPLVLCHVNNDGIAVLSGQLGSTEAIINVYSCHDIHNAETKEDFNINVNPRATISLISVCEQFFLGLRDKMCYSNTKFYLSCYHTSRVYQFDINGKYERIFGEPASRMDLKEEGKLYKPCGVFADNTENLIIACYDGIHQISLNTADWSPVKALACKHGVWYTNDVIYTIKDTGFEDTTEITLPHLPSNHIEPKKQPYRTKEGDAICGNTPTSVHVANGRTIQRVPLDAESINCDQIELTDDIKSILGGVSIKTGRLGGEINCIVVMGHDGIREAICVWSGDRKEDQVTSWALFEMIYMDIEDPLLVCSVNTDKIAILSGKYGSPCAIIHLFIDTFADTFKGPLTEIMVCSTVGISPEPKPLSLGTRDKMCYYNQHFYISCFNTSTVYQVDHDGKVMHTYPGPDLNTKLNEQCAVFAERQENKEYILIACSDGSIHQRTIRQDDDESLSEDWKILHVANLDKARGFWFNDEVGVIVKHVYPTPLRVDMVSKMNKGRIEPIELSNSEDYDENVDLEYSTLINTSEPDTVIVTIHKNRLPDFMKVTVNNDGNRLNKRGYSIGRIGCIYNMGIQLGVLIRQEIVDDKKQELYMFVLGNKDNDGTILNHLCTVLVDSDSATIKNRFEMEYDVIHIFPMDKQFGVLCRNGNDCNDIDRIHVYTPDMLEHARMFQHSTMPGWGHIINLAGSNKKRTISVSVTSHGIICSLVSREFPEFSIRIYGAGGSYLTTVCRLPLAFKVICTRDDHILVVFLQGKERLYKPKWDKICKMKGEKNVSNVSDVGEMEGDESGREENVSDMSDVGVMEGDRDECEDESGTLVWVSKRNLIRGDTMLSCALTEEYMWCIQDNGEMSEKLHVYPIDTGGRPNRVLCSNNNIYGDFLVGLITDIFVLPLLFWFGDTITEFLQ